MRKPSQKRLLRLLHHNWNHRTLSALSFIVEKILVKGCFTEINVKGLEKVKPERIMQIFITSYMLYTLKVKRQLSFL